MNKALLFLTYHIIFSASLIPNTNFANIDIGSSFIYDLSDRVGISWSVITPPAPFTEKSFFHMPSPKDGVAVFVHQNKYYLCLWESPRWRNIFTSSPPHVMQPFKIRDKVWFTTPDTIFYRQTIKYFDGEKVHSVSSPQANGIRSLFFTDFDDGWAGCEWGQLMRWDGIQWKLTSSFTPYHIEGMFTTEKSTLLARNDIPAQKSIELFEFKNQEWHTIQKLPFKGGNEKIIFLQKHSYYLMGPDSLFSWRNNKWRPVDIPVVSTDTLLLPINVNPSQLVWTSSKGPVRSNNFYYLEDQSACNDSDIICVVPVLGYSTAANAKTFYLFSKTGLRKMLHIIAKDFRPAKKRIHFQINKILQSGNEAGLCIADFSGDGIEDVYAVVSGAGNRLYPASRTKIPGAFDEIAEESGTLGGTFTEDMFFNYDNSASYADIDNDGDQDILVTSLYGPSVLFRQVGKGRFIDYSRTSRLNRDFGRSFLGIWTDADQDGCIDLFVNNSDSASHFYRNNGAGIFIDITNLAGFNDIRSSAAAFGDIDNDGDDDLVHTAGSHICLFKNNSNGKSIRFTKQPQISITDADSLAPISTLFLADLDNDGDLDIFATRVMAPNLLLKNEKGVFSRVDDQPGMPEKEYSIEAVPLDADNDGDLDIFVSNRGSIAFYENCGALKFQKIDITNHPQSYGGAVAVGDFENDGDIDIYTSDGGTYSRVFINAVNDGNFIKLKLVGASSNRDAIGARVDIYRADSSRRYLGMRTINGGQGVSSASSQIIHIGVPDKGRNLVIRFPSGVIHRLENVSRGEFLTIREYEGISWQANVFKNWIRRKVYYTPLQNDILFLTAMFALFFLMLVILKRTLKWTQRSAILLLWLPLSLLVIIFSLLHRENFIYDYVIPALFGAGAWIIGLIFVQKTARQSAQQQEIEEALYFKTAAFFHGEWGASRLNRLALFLANIDADALADSDVCARLSSNIEDFFTLLAPEIDKILHLASQLPGLKEQQRATRKTFDNFVRDLNDIKIKFALGEVSDNVQNYLVLENISFLQQNIRLLRRHVSSRFTTDVNHSLKTLVDENRSDVKISLEMNCPHKLAARIRPTEFSQIVDNLIHNAERAMEKSHRKNMTVKCRANMERVFISLSDTGGGVPPTIEKRLFKEQVTTKKQGGGFGLYHAARILARYGGAISLVSSSPGRGATFLIELKRVDYE